jgi:hypothetical protein
VSFLSLPAVAPSRAQFRSERSHVFVLHGKQNISVFPIDAEMQRAPVAFYRCEEAITRFALTHKASVFALTALRQLDENSSDVGVLTWAPLGNKQ